MTENNAIAERLPEEIRRYTEGAVCFRETDGRSGADVWRVGAREGLFLKKAPKGSLQNAALMQRFLSPFRLAPETVAYVSEDEDWLLSAKAEGESGISPRFLSDPARLAAEMGLAARTFHETPVSGCPVGPLSGRLRENFDRSARENPVFQAYIGNYLGVQSAEEAVREVARLNIPLSDDTVIHGDMCLPNFMFSDFRFTCMIDVGDGGLGDRNYDLFWALWSMNYNFHTDRYKDVFLDAYGRDRADEDKIRLCGLLCSVGE